MNDAARQKLIDMIATYGTSVCEDTRRCEALLRDYCAEFKREMNVLVSALGERVVSDLLNSEGKLPPEIALSQLSKRLKDDLALSEEASRWAVESWMIALEILSRVEPPPIPVPCIESSRIEPPSIGKERKKHEEPEPQRVKRKGLAQCVNKWSSRTIGEAASFAVLFLTAMLLSISIFFVIVRYRTTSNICTDFDPSLPLMVFGLLIIAILLRTITRR